MSDAAATSTRAGTIGAIYTRIRKSPWAPHVGASLVLLALDLLLMRRWLFTGAFPAGVDSGFLYSLIPFFEAHHISAFTAWLPGATRRQGSPNCSTRSA